MYLIDTNVISEYRKKNKAARGVIAFFHQIIEQRTLVFISVVTVGELRP
jgi:predicted nucleic acid-binding protein